MMLQEFWPMDIRLAGVVLWAVLATGCAPVVSASDTSKANASDTNLSDDAYVAYRNTHENSPKIPKMILALIRMHMEKKEYLLARFYCDEYRRDYPSGKHRIKVEYLRAKALFFRYEQQLDERLADQARAEGRAFVSQYPRSKYRIQMEGLLRELQVRQNARYEQLAQYYEKRGKPKAAKIYRDRIVH
jgi:outer membrane protein assembly factor BamD